MIKIALFGGPGSGKTTCASAFASFMNSNGISFYHIPEYARTFIDTYGADAIKECGPLLQAKFVTKQLQRESEVPPEVHGFITDSPIFLSWIYAAYYGCDSIASYIARKDNYKAFLKNIYTYDHIFRVNREFDYKNDGCRYQSEDESIFIDNAIATILKLHGVSFVDLSGSTDDRIAKICEIIGENSGTRNREKVLST